MYFIDCFCLYVSIAFDHISTVQYAWQIVGGCYSQFILCLTRGYQQQDAHEFMRYLLDHLHRELQYSRNGASLPVSPQDGIILSAAEGKCRMYVDLTL